MTQTTLARRLDDGPADIVPEQILPVQFADVLRRSAQVPELRLMSAVLQDALRAFCQYAEVDGGRAARLFDEIANWFGSTDATWPFSFENICDALDLDPAWIRGLLARWRREHAGPGAGSVRIPPMRHFGGNRPAVRGEALGFVHCAEHVA